MTTKLKAIREELEVSQEYVVRQTNISFSAYRNAETGKRVQYGTAKEILDAINRLRQNKGLDPITIEDLGLKLY